MKKLRVLLSDPMSSSAAQLLTERGIEAVQTGKMTPNELHQTIATFDGLAIRSTSKVTAELLTAATRLRVIGRAGIGVDNIDVPACTSQGIVVMNTPMGNAITTAEHTLAMMFSLARQIPQANQTTHAGTWEKSRYIGMELTGKVLGIIGSGNIGSIVAKKAIGCGLKVQAYDPFLTAERAVQIGVQKVTLDELLASSDIVSLHVPRTTDTENMINANAIQKMKPGALLINCARGGLVDEAALRVALENNYLKGAAFDVFAVEPAQENILFGLENVICTPHLGASTVEAQEKVAVQVAGQIADYLLDGSIQNALNAPSLSAEELRVLKPYLQLSHCLGSFVGQLTRDAITSVTINYSGDVAKLNIEPLTTQIVHSILQYHCDVNTINARQMARDRGTRITQAKDDVADVYQNRITLTVSTAKKQRSISGSVMQGKPRIIEIKGIKLESEIGQHMLYITNRDQPGMIGVIGQFTACKNINIANMHLGRRQSAGDAISLLEIDERIQPDDLQALRNIQYIDDAQYLHFQPLLP